MTSVDAPDEAGKYTDNSHLIPSRVCELGGGHHTACALGKYPGIASLLHKRQCLVLCQLEYLVPSRSGNFYGRCDCFHMHSSCVLLGVLVLPYWMPGHGQCKERAPQVV